MRALTYIAASLALATAVNVAGFVVTTIHAETRIGTPVKAWIHYGSTRTGDSVQHLTTAYYLGVTRERALALCQTDLKDIVAFFEAERKKPAREREDELIAPRCTPERPWSWVERS